MTERTDPWSRVARLWPLLAMTRIPGTPRPWRPSELTGARRAERDKRLREERRMAEVFLGPAPAPVHLDVVDVIRRLWVMLLDSTVELEQVHPPQRRPQLPDGDDPGPVLEWCRKRARSQPGCVPVDRAAWDMLRVIESALGEIWGGQKLQAICPWCHGGIIPRPTWRVRILPGQMPAIVCESGTCEPPPADAGTWHRSQPAWPIWEWDWLAQQLETEEQRQAARRAAISG